MHPKSSFFLQLIVCISFTLIEIPVMFAQMTIPIESSSNALVLQVDKENNISTVYFGKKLANPAEYGQISMSYHQANDFSEMLNAAYTSSGSRNLMEPAITVTHADGNNSLDLRYVDHTVETMGDNVKLYTINLKDPVYPFMVRLFYKVFYKEDVVEQM